MNYPYDDDNMTYDLTHHRYVLTPTAVLQDGTNLSTYLDSTGDANPSTMGLRVLNMISRHLYSWIYSRIPNANKPFIEYLLATYPPCREIIQECLLNETYFALKNGDFWNYADSDIPEGKTVSLDTRNILADELPNGLCLLTVQPLPYGVPESVYRVNY